MFLIIELSAFAVLSNLAEVVTQRIRQFGYFRARLIVRLHSS